MTKPERPCEPSDGRAATPLAAGVDSERERAAEPASGALAERPRARVTVRGLARRLGRELALARRERGLGVFAVAERAGVPVQYVQAVERGDWTSLVLFFRLCRAVEVTCAELIRSPLPRRLTTQGVRRGGEPFARNLGPAPPHEAFWAAFRP